MTAFKLKNIVCRIVFFAVIFCLLAPAADALPQGVSSSRYAALSPALELSTGMFRNFFLNSCALFKKRKAGEKEQSPKLYQEYQVLVRAYDSRIEVKKAEGVSAFFVEEVLKRVLSQLNKRKVWSDFPNFYSHNDFSFGFKLGQKEFYIIDRNKNIISLPVSLLDNFSALLFTIRHVIHCLNNPRLVKDKILNADAFFFLNLFDYERKEILQWPELSFYENRELLAKIQQGVSENDFSLLFELLFKENLSADTNEELKGMFIELTKALQDVNVSKGRMLNFFMLLWDISEKNRNAVKVKENFQNLLYGLKSIPPWSKFVPESNSGVFITKLGDLLSESQFGMHQSKAVVKSLLENTVIDTLLYFQKIERKAEQLKAGKAASFRMKHSASVRGVMGEISGLHKYTFVFKDTLRILDEQPEIDSRNKVYVSYSINGEEVSKECDAHTAKTILEFKYATRHRDIYRQIAGFMKPVSVFSLLLNAHQKKVQSLRTKRKTSLNSDDQELVSVKNVVYFAENDTSDLANDVYRFITANKDSFDPKTKLSLFKRTVWNEDGFSVRLNLQEFKKLLLDKAMAKKFWAEREDRQLKSAFAEEKKTQFLSRYCNYIFPEMEKIYQETGFDVYISISNPKISGREESFVYAMTLSDDISSGSLEDVPLSLPYNPGMKLALLIEESI